MSESSRNLLAALSQTLHELDLPKPPVSASLGTSALNQMILRFSSLWQLRAEPEYKHKSYVRKDGRQGRIDWLLQSRDPQVSYALEIDRHNKRWSLEKLVRSEALGYLPVWIRWRSPVLCPVPDSVFLIDLSVSRVSGFQRQRRQSSASPPHPSHS